MATAADNEKTRSAEDTDLNFSVNPASKRLLDAIVSILAEEYIQKAKENPDIFSE